MRRTDFLKELERALDGQIPSEIVVKNLRYYSEYIRNEIKKGRPEGDILDELGDPRLIARSITDAEIAEEKEAGVWSADRSFASRGSYDDVIFDGYDSDGTEEYSEAPEDSSDTYERASKPPRQPRFSTVGGFGWDIRLTLIIAGILLLVLCIVGVFFKAVFSILTSRWFWMMIIIWFAVRFIVRFFSDR